MNKKKVILSGSGKEWSEESTAIMDAFAQWLSMSGLKEAECLSRIEGNTFEIYYQRKDDKAAIALIDEAGGIGVPFPWWNESGIPFEHYITDAALLLLHIGSLCNNETTLKKINDFAMRNAIQYAWNM